MIRGYNREALKQLTNSTAPMSSTILPNATNVLVKVCEIGTDLDEACSKILLLKRALDRGLTNKKKYKYANHTTKS